MAQRNVIHRALATYLNDNFSLANKVAWENASFKPLPDEIWFEELFFPNISGQATLGTSGLQEDIGFYQINVRVPIGTGTIEADNYVDELTQIYKLGTTINKDGEEIYIENSTPAPGIKEDNWYVIPFTVNWSCKMTIN